MAVDHAILQLYPKQHQPTLRLYGWSPPCLSLGIAQRFADVRSERCMDRGISVVRRPTGGRAIFHDRELTYALVTSQHDPLVTAPTIVESYGRISQALMHGLRALDIPVTWAAPTRSVGTTSAACFDVAAAYELTVAGRKLVGSAQARQQGVLLQQGTLLLHADTHALADLLHLPPALNPDRLAQRLIALDEILGVEPDWNIVADAIIAGLCEAWNITLTPGTLTPAELTLANELIETRYGNEAWTRRR